MKENEDDIDNDKILLTNNELEKELLENPSINLNASGNSNFNLSNINDELRDSNNNSLIANSEHNNICENNNNNNLIINKIEDNNSNKSKFNRFSSKASSKKEDEEFEKALLYNIDYEKTQNIIEMLNKDINKAILIVSDDMNILQRASFLNRISSVKTIIKELKNNFNKENELNLIKNFINSKNKRGYTSLHYSIICGNIEIYKYLIKNGADRNITTNSGYNNLILACQTKRTYVFLEEIKHQIINKRLDINLLFNIKDKNNATLLHWSAFSDYLFGTQYLLSLYDKTISSNKNINFVNFINSKDNNNMTALQYAIMNNSNKAIKELILLKNIDLYNKDVDNRDSFDYAEAMKNENFNEILKIKNTKFNIFKRLLYLILIIIYNISIYFITLPIINKLFILYIQLAISFLLILFYLIIKIIINPGSPKGNSNNYNNMIFNINENNIYKELTEIIKYCPYCYSKKEKTTTKHCPICCLCVENFIMHDSFFNKCIGRKNYFFYILFKLIFIIYLLFFILISFWSIFIDLDDDKKIISPLIKVDKFYCDEAISILSYGTIFIFIWMLFLKIWELYKECKLTKNINILRHSLGLDKLNSSNSRKESIM